MKQTIIRSLCVLFVYFCSVGLFSQSSLEGRVLDKKTKEALTGATVMVEGTAKGITTDIDGNFRLALAPGKYTILVSYVSYKTLRTPNVIVEKEKGSAQLFELEDAALTLESVQVVGRRRTDTELSMLKSVRSSLQVVSGISSQQIGKTMDKDASEVVKRVSGVSIQDNRFVVVRGLNQRYNNVWLNNAATPSSETDVKAFSFDAIPSNMIDNLVIYKSGSPELSAEATGGFIKISTKNIPDENFVTVEYGAGYNEKSSFKDSYMLGGSSLDFLGLGSSARNIPSNFPANMNLVDVQQRDAQALRLSNNWISKKQIALPNQKATFSFGKKWDLNQGAKLGTITALSYSNSFSTRSNMQNDAYERFDPETETPTYLYNYKADIYSNEYKLGILHNWAYQTANGFKLEFKNILNQIGVDKTANTEGWNNYRQGDFKYFNNQYSSRTTYSGQLIGTHKLGENEKLEWIAGFAYANRIEPNRQNWSMKKSSNGIYEYMLPMVPSINELGRLYLTNHEYVSTAALNYEKPLAIGEIHSTLKAGAYSEYKTRNFSERSICYKKNNNGLFSEDEINALSFNQLFTEQYLGQNKILSLAEETNAANSYEAQNLLAAGYIALNMPLGSFNIYGGLRAEFNNLKLDGYYDAVSPAHIAPKTFNLFPSINASYNINEKTLIRMAYARTINRPEFRELAPINYYDFTEKYSVKGNPNLKDAIIHNVDLRFEFYPTPGETFSLAAFYKQFTNPIEMVSVGTGSEFSFQNAKAANNYGIELEIKKSLESLIGLRNFGISMNASYIYSLVEFANNVTERNRALQGQSPYVINASLFYQNDKLGLSSSLMYNVMGERILVAAQLNQGTVVIPDICEKPRNVIDFVLTKKIGKKLQLKFGVKDILAQDLITRQKFEYQKNGVEKSITLINKLSNTGRTWSIGATWSL